MMFRYPVISVERKKELVGNYKSNSEYRPKGEPRLVNDHNFMEPLGKVPCGIYDIDCDEGYVSIRVSSDTAEFAVNSIRS